MVRRFAVTSLTLVVLAVFGQSVAAKPKANERLAFDLSAAVEETYDSNVFQAKNAESDLVTTLVPGLSVSVGAIPYLRIGGSYALRYLYYLNHSELNDFFHKGDINLGVDFSKTRRFRNFRLETEFAYDPVTISATNSAGAGVNSTQRLTAGIIPGYFWQINPRMDFDSEVRIARTMYLGEGESSYSGDMNLTMRRKIAQRLFFKVGGTGTYQKFDTLGTTIIYGALLGFDMEIFKRLNGGISGGYQIVNLPSGESSDAITMAINLEYLLSKRTSITLVGNRSNTVDINNREFVATGITLGARHRLSMRSLLGLDLFWSQTQQESLVNGVFLGDELQSVGGSVRLQYTDRWTFALRALRDVNGGANVATDYTQNRLILEAKYHFPIKF